MAATVAHEINNPLEGLINLVFLARTSGSIKEVRRYLQTAEKELERVAHIARQTLGYYRNTGSPADVDLRKTIEDVLMVYEGRCASRGITVECEFDNPRKVVARREDLIQTFSNIITNSIDAMPQGGTIHISIEETTVSEAEGVRIVFRDEGTGIPVEHQKRIFEPFFTTKGSVGTGIGLWVVKQLIEQQHGQITVTSNTDSADSGTAVSIFLPFLGARIARQEGHVN
jgi:signal transduction histidine kinase